MPDALNYGRNFASKVIANTADDIFTLDSGILRNLVIYVNNITGSAATLDGWLIPASGSAASANKFLNGYSIAGNASAEIPVPKMIEGDTLTLQASTSNALTIFDHDSVTRV